MSRPAAPEADRQPTRAEAAVRVVPLRDDPARWGHFRELLAAYRTAIREEFPHSRSLDGLERQAQQMMVALAYRGERAAGFAMMQARTAADGERVWWISHLHAPGDLAVSRALCRAAELIARRFGCQCVAFESRMPRVAQTAKLAGFAPISTVYAKNCAAESRAAAPRAPRLTLLERNTRRR